MEQTLRILLTGGSGCGKSTYAEALALRHPTPRYYISAMRPQSGSERAEADANALALREKGFIVLARPTGLAGLTLPGRGLALLECLCHLTANEMFASDGSFQDPVEEILAGLMALSAQCDTLIVVTNQVGGDGICYPEGTRRYIEALGRLNAAVARQFDRVLELVCGIPTVLK